jgi:hypothetical protein
MTELETIRSAERVHDDNRTFVYDWLNPTFPYLKGYAESRIFGSARVTTVDPPTGAVDEALQLDDRANRPSVTPVTDLLPRLAPPVPTRLLGQWEGMVERVTGSTFAARIVDLKANRPEELAEFDIDDVSPDDWPLVVPGGLFFWSIVRETRGGRPTQKSELRFRRLIADPETNIERARQWATEVAELFKDSASDD